MAALSLCVPGKTLSTMTQRDGGASQRPGHSRTQAKTGKQRAWRWRTTPLPHRGREGMDLLVSCGLGRLEKVEVHFAGTNESSLL